MLKKMGYALRHSDEIFAVLSLATKKIGKCNPKASEIEANNRKRQEWNRAVDMALISGIPEPQIMEVKQKRSSEPIKSAISRKGRKPNLFAKVVTMAIEALELMIESVLVKKYKESLEQKEELQKTDVSEMRTVMPETGRTEAEINEPVERLPEPKQPEMTRMASKYPRFYKIYNELEQQNNAIYKKEKQRSAKKKELSEIKGWFKGRKKKELREELALTEEDPENISKKQKKKARRSQKERQAAVVNAIKNKIEAGIYPMDLWEEKK